MPGPTERLARGRLRALALAALFPLAVGCGQGGPGFAPVEGTVTYGQKPLANVSVEFYPVVPEGEAALPFSYGLTDEHGKYTLSSQNNQTGAVVGKHRVAIRRLPEPDPDRNAPPKPPRLPYIPVKFTVVVTTPIEIEVTPDQQVYNIELTRYQ
jgi:hypothetical protein